MLKERIAAGERLIGTFVKTPHFALVEVLGLTGIDFVILDAEHAPFGMTEIDRCALAARATGLPLLVRLPEASPSTILRVLDVGVTGIVVPQVSTVEQAQAVVRATTYGPGGRGFAGTTRAGDFGAMPAAELVGNARKTVVIVQIEDAEGVQNAAAITATEGVDACFVGRADLSASLGLFDLQAPEIETATRHVFDQCKAHGVSPMAFVSDLSDCPAWFERGAGMIAVGSEHKAIQSYFDSAKRAAAKE